MVIKMKSPKKLFALLVAVMCAVLAAGGCNPQKTPDYGINPVALSVNGVDITLFDFDRFYTTNEKYYYLTHGAVDAQEYFETVLDEVVRYGVALSKAQELNIQLTAEDEDEVQNELQTQCDLTFEKYSKTLADSSTASAAPALDSKTVEAAFREDKGYSFAEYRGFLARFLRNKKIISKLYEQITADVAPDEEEIIAYIQLNVSEQSLDSFSTFVTRYKSFVNEKGDVPFFVPEDCFTVDQLLLQYSSDESESTAEPDASGTLPAYTFDTASVTASEIDSILSVGVSYDDFIDLIARYGNDENMQGDVFLRWGYLIHNTLFEDYEKPLLIGAHYAHGIEQLPPELSNKNTSSQYFETTDGKRIVKITAKGSIRYVVENRSLAKGPMPYVEGDEVWNLSYDGALAAASDIEYDDQFEVWFSEANVTYYYDRFKSNYISPAVPEQK